MKNKRWWYIGGGVAIVLLSLLVWRWTARSEKIEYRFDKIDRGDIAVTISATGTLNAVRTVQVGSQVSGTIAKLYVDFNAVVKEGQLVAQLDPTFLQASVNEQRANVDRARAQKGDAERNLNRTKELYSKSLVSQVDLDAATTNLEAAKATLAQGEAALQRAVVNLQYATIRAPISGVVISRSVDVGQTVAASLSAPTLFTIANDLRNMQVQANVDEADIGNVKIGQDVSFRVDSYPDREFHGTVSQVRLAPVVTQNVVTYTVIIDVNNPDQKLMPGMTATVSIQVDSREGVLRVPIQATRFTPPDVPVQGFPRPGRDSTRGSGQGGRDSTRGGEQGSRDTRAQGRQGGMGGGAGVDPERRAEMMRKWMSKGRIWVMENGKPKPVMITRGLQNTRYVEIVESDLKEGDEVIIGALGAQTKPAGNVQQSPFQPQMGGGGGRRGGM